MEVLLSLFNFTHNVPSVCGLRIGRYDNGDFAVENEVFEKKIQGNLLDFFGIESYYSNTTSGYLEKIHCIIRFKRKLELTEFKSLFAEFKKRFNHKKVEENYTERTPNQNDWAQYGKTEYLNECKCKMADDDYSIIFDGNDEDLLIVIEPCRDDISVYIKFNELLDK